MEEKRENWHLRIATLLALASVALLAKCVYGQESSRLAYLPKEIPVDRSKIEFYDHGRVYQHNGGFHDARYNISADQPRERFGNANLELPWKTGGIDRSDNATSLKFVIMGTGPITYQHRPRQRMQVRGTIFTKDPFYEWKYPEGTVFGEILQVSHAGVDYTFEVRTRTKKDGSWQSDLYRPYNDRRDLANLLGKDPVVGQGIYRLKDENHDSSSFDVTALVDELGPIASEDVRRILAKPFKSVKGRAFDKAEDGIEGYAPTTRQAFSVVPRNYDGAFLQVSDASCMKCHDTILKSTSEIQLVRDWYGMVRGSDATFSFSIADPSSVSTNGFDVQPRFRRGLSIQPER